MTPLSKPQRLLLAISIGMICAGLVPRLLPVGVSGPIDKVVAIYESEDSSVVQTNVLNGSTANALRKAEKWKQYDKDQIPEEYKATFEPITKKLGIPCLILLKGGKVAWSQKLPDSNESLDAVVKKQGGV